jgi:tetratricopeptide (TPR) repeat protein
MALLLLSPVVFASVLAGCGESAKPITIRYDRPARYAIPEGVNKIAVAEFSSSGSRDQHWGEAASDRLTSDLQALSQEEKYKRYELVDRKNLKKIMDEQDLQIASITDAAQAAKVGQVAKVDAMIYGNATVITRDERGSKQVIDPLNRSTKTVDYTKRFVQVTVNFTMDNVRTSKMLATAAVKREWDSEKDGKKGGMAAVTGALGVGDSQPDAAAQVIGRLVDECCHEFVGMICPHPEVVTERLESGKSKKASRGNTLAEEGDYKGALDFYLEAIQENPDDAGAMFNAGLMYEATGNLEKAGEFYNRAWREKDLKKYAAARQRVLREAEAPKAGNGKAKPADSD